MLDAAFASWREVQGQLTRTLGGDAADGLRALAKGVRPQAGARLPGA